MNEIKSLFDAALAVESSCAELDEVLTALRVLDECFEAEGYQPEDHFEEWKAVNFARRFSLYLDTFRVLRRDLARISIELNAVGEQCHVTHEAQERATP